MPFRLETASGLRLYACSIRMKLGESASIQFLDPYEQTKFEKIELVFESITLAKSYRLNNIRLHHAFKFHKIVPKSLFLHEVVETNTNIYVIRKSNDYDDFDIMSHPWTLFRG